MSEFLKIKVQADSVGDLVMTMVRKGPIGERVMRELTVRLKDVHPSRLTSAGLTDAYEIWRMAPYGDNPVEVDFAEIMKKPF